MLKRILRNRFGPPPGAKPGVTVIPVAATDRSPADLDPADVRYPTGTVALEGVRLPPGQSPNLDDAAERLRQPVVVSHDRLGDLHLDRTTGSFTGTGRWKTGRLEMIVPAEGDHPQPDALRAADFWMRQAEAKLERCKRFAAEELLALKNESWREAGDKVYPDDAFVLHFHDGDLFWGHGVSVEGTTDGRLLAADLAG